MLSPAKASLKVSLLWTFRPSQLDLCQNRRCFHAKDGAESEERIDGWGLLATLQLADIFAGKLGSRREFLLCQSCLMSRSFERFAQHPATVRLGRRLVCEL